MQHRASDDDDAGGTFIQHDAGTFVQHDAGTVVRHGATAADGGTFVQHDGGTIVQHGDAHHQDTVAQHHSAAAPAAQRRRPAPVETVRALPCLVPCSVLILLTTLILVKSFASVCCKFKQYLNTFSAGQADAYIQACKLWQGHPVQVSRWPAPCTKLCQRNSILSDIVQSGDAFGTAVVHSGAPSRGGVQDSPAGVHLVACVYTDCVTTSEAQTAIQCFLTTAEHSATCSLTLSTRLVCCNIFATILLQRACLLCL